MARRKKVQRAESNDAFEKVYVSGLNWSRLSNIYVGELNVDGVVSRLANYSYFSSLYGMPLCGFSTNPNVLPTNSDDYVGLTYSGKLSTNATYFPVFGYDQLYRLSSNISEIKTQLTDLSSFNVDENVELQLNLSDYSLDSLCARLEIGTKAYSDGEYLDSKCLLSIDGIPNNKKIVLKSGEFRLSALLNGNGCISDWIDVSENLNHLSVSSFRFLPRQFSESELANIDDIAMSNRLFSGTAYLLTSGSSNYYSESGGANEDYKSCVIDIFLNDSSPNNDFCQVEYVNHEPILKNCLNEKLELIDDFYHSKIQKGQNFPDRLSSGIIEVYNGVLKPNKTGWYSFSFFADDALIVSIDDKILINEFGILSTLINENDYRKQRFSVSSIIYSNMLLDSGRPYVEDGRDDRYYGNYGSTQSAHISGANALYDAIVSAKNPGIDYLYIQPFQNYLSTDLLFKSIYQIYVISYDKRIGIARYGESQSIFLVAGHKYLFKAIFCDATCADVNHYGYAVFNQCKPVIDQTSNEYGQCELSLHSYDLSEFTQENGFYDDKDTYVLLSSMYAILSGMLINNLDNSNMVDYKIMRGSDILDRDLYKEGFDFDGTVSANVSNVIQIFGEEKFRNFSWSNVYKKMYQWRPNMQNFFPKIPFVLNDLLYDYVDRIKIMQDNSNACYKIFRDKNIEEQTPNISNFDNDGSDENYKLSRDLPNPPSTYEIDPETGKWPSNPDSIEISVFDVRDDYDTHSGTIHRIAVVVDQTIKNPTYIRLTDINGNLLKCANGRTAEAVCMNCVGKNTFVWTNVDTGTNSKILLQTAYGQLENDSYNMTLYVKSMNTTIYERNIKDAHYWMYVNFSPYQLDSFTSFT